MINKTIISGRLLEKPRRSDLHSEYYLLKLDCKTTLKTGVGVVKQLDTVIPLIVPSFLNPASFEAGSQVYAECSYIPPFVLTDSQVAVTLWANVLKHNVSEVKLSVGERNHENSLVESMSDYEKKLSPLSKAV